MKNKFATVQMQKMNREAREERKDLMIFFANFACFAVRILNCTVENF